MKLLLLSQAIPRIVLDFFPEIQCVDSHFDIDYTANAGICDTVSYVDAMLSTQRVDVVVVTTECDQMRRAADLWQMRYGKSRIFLWNIPTVTRQSLMQKMYAEELQRWGRWLQNLSPMGTPQLRETFSMQKGVQKDVQKLKPLALVGSPWLKNQEQLYHWFESRGFEIVLDWSENAEARTDIGSMQFLDIEAIASHFVEHYFSPFQKPNSAFYESFLSQVKLHQCQGIIVLRTAWCDQWRGVFARMQELSDVPVMEWIMDSNESLNENSRILTRLEAFLEFLN